MFVFLFLEFVTETLQGGDSFLLVEIGEQTCDVRVTSRIRLLVQKLEALNLGLAMNPNIGCKYFTHLANSSDIDSRDDSIQRKHHHTKGIVEEGDGSRIIH